MATGGADDGGEAKTDCLGVPLRGRGRGRHDDLAQKLGAADSGMSSPGGTHLDGTGDPYI